MAGIADKVPSMDDNKLMALFKNAHRENQKGNPNALTVLDAIQSEWRSRVERAKSGHYKATMPNKGMLSAFGYCVGASGVVRNKRLELLNLIFESDLPIVGSPAYTAEWGEKSSKERYLRMHRTLSGLVNSNKNFESMEQAVDDWMSDLDYVDLEFKGKVNS